MALLCLAWLGIQNASGHWERMGGDVGYGYSLWVLPLGANGELTGAHMSGVGGQYLLQPICIVGYYAASEIQTGWSPHFCALI